MRTLFILLFLYVHSLGAFAQEGEMDRNYIALTGMVTSMNLLDSTERVLVGAPIEIWANSEKLISLISDEHGEYRFQLPYGNKYTIKYGADPYVRKMVEMDATDFSAESIERGFDMIIDISLFEDHNYSLDFLDQEPIARAEYNKRKETAVWDYKYTDSVTARMREAIKTSGK